VGIKLAFFINMGYSVITMTLAARDAVQGVTSEIIETPAVTSTLQDILIPVPEAIGDSQKTPYTSVDRHAYFTIKEIDDSLIAGFDLETFKHLHFTAWKKTKLFFEHTFPFITQSLFNPFFKLVYGTSFNLKITGREHLKNLRGPALFIANHIAMYDSFVFDIFVKPFSHFLPFRFMGSRTFIVPILTVLKMIGIVDLVYLFFGVFRITPGEGAEKSLKKAYEIIHEGGTVVMYPEGKIWRPTPAHPEPIGPFKWGAAILAKNTGTQVIPVSFKKINNGVKKKPDLIVNIGKPFFVDLDKKPEVIAEDMKQVVTTLYNSN
jgi:1-acyl-sn-glycerol-3-phosphate acyltransferase